MRRTWAVLLAAALLAAGVACGGDDEVTSTAPGTAPAATTAPSEPIADQRRGLAATAYLRAAERSNRGLQQATSMLQDAEATADFAQAAQAMRLYEETILAFQDAVIAIDFPQELQPAADAMIAALGRERTSASILVQVLSGERRPTDDQWGDLRHARGDATTQARVLRAGLGLPPPARSLDDE